MKRLLYCSVGISSLSDLSILVDFGSGHASSPKFSSVCLDADLAVFFWGVFFFFLVGLSFSRSARMRCPKASRRPSRRTLAGLSVGSWGTRLL